MTVSARKVIERWKKDPSWKREYDALGDEYALASALINARTKAKLSQTELAERMGTTQSTIARLESGRAKPSITTLRKFAAATGMRVAITFVPQRRSSTRWG